MLNKLQFVSWIKIKTHPYVFNNWANFYKGEIVSNTILNVNSLEKLINK